MTTSKETLDVGESPVSQGTSRPKTGSGQLRSDAVSLDVPIKVHGSRVTEVALGTTPHTEPFEEHTTTMIVFPQGGVLRMSTTVKVGQAVVVTNLKSKQDAICRIVKVRTNPNLHSYVEIEFTHPQPGYWGVYFASDRLVLAKRSAPAVQSVASSPAAPINPAVAPKIEVPAKERTVPAAPVRLAQVPQAPVAKPQDVRPTALPPSPAASLSPAEMRGDTSGVSESSSGTAAAEELEVGLHVAEETSAKKVSVTFGRFAASSSLNAPQAASREFGSRLEYGTLGHKGQTTEIQDEGRNWFAIIAAVAVLFAVAGAFYFYRRPSTRLSISAPTAPELPTRTDAVENPVSAPPPANELAGQQASMPNTKPAVTVRTNEGVPSRPSKSAAHENKPGVSPKGKTPRAEPAVPDMFGALNAHPVSALHETEGSREAAPSIEPGMAAGETGALPEVGPHAVNLAPPAQPAPEGPVSVGGEVRPPKVISSVPPIYPLMALQANVQGNVVVRITIDRAGSVSDAQAISGPAILRQAAVDALRQRKYAPSTLNGQPISVEMLVTIQFRR